MYFLNKKGKKEAVPENVKSILPKLLVFLLLTFSLVILSGFVTSETLENSLGNSEMRISFDVKIIDFESPMELGEFFEFTYLVRGMSGINDDIKINFWIEKQGEIVSSGSDTVYIGDFKEKIETTKIFLPKNVESGVYSFFVEVVHEDYEAKSHRTIEIEIKKGIARITTAEGKVLSTYVISALIALAIFVLSLIFYLDRRKIRTQFLQGERWIKKYKKSVLIFSLFLIIGILFYYLNLFGEIVKWMSKLILGSRINVFQYLSSSSFYYTFGIILIFIALAFLIIILKKKKLFKKLKRERILEKQYKTTVKESKVKFKKVSKSQNKIVKKFGSFLKRINPLKLVKFLLNFLKKSVILFVKLIKKIKFKKIKFKHKKKVKKPKKLKKPVKIKKVKKKKIKIKNIFSKYHPFKHIKIFFGKIIKNLKKLKIKFPKKQKKKEKLINVKRVHEKQKKLEISRKIKFKKFWVKIKRIVNKLGIILRKLSRYLRSKSKSSKTFVSKKSKQVSKEEKKVLKNDKKEIQRIYKSVFKSLNKIFGKKSREETLKNFEKTFVETGKFTKKHLQTLRNVLGAKLKVEKRQLKKEFKEDRLNFQKTFCELRKNGKNLIDDLARYSREHKKAVFKDKKERRIRKKERIIKRKEKEEKNRIRVNKIFRFFKKKSKSSKTFVSKKSKQVSKEEKKIARKAKKELKKAYKNVFRLLKKIFGKKSQKKIMRDFEKSIVETKKFSAQSLETLKNLVNKKREIKRRKIDFSKVNELRRNAKDLIRELADYVDKFISTQKKNLKQKSKFFRDSNA